MQKNVTATICVLMHTYFICIKEKGRYKCGTVKLSGYSVRTVMLDLLCGCVCTLAKRVSVCTVLVWALLDVAITTHRKAAVEE